MTILSKDKIYFDTDTVSSFLCVNREDILISLFGKRIILTGQVEAELFKVPSLKPNMPPFKTIIREYQKKGFFIKETMSLYSSEWMQYELLTKNFISQKPIIGKGEASVIAFAKINGATMASSNLRDVSSYINLYKLKNILIEDILFMGISKQLIKKDEAILIWRKMRNNKRKLPPESSFIEFLNAKNIF